MKAIQNITNALAAVESTAKLPKIVLLMMIGAFTILPHGEVAAQQTDLSFAASKALSAVVQIQSFMSDCFYEKHASIATQMGIKSLGSGGSKLIGSASGVLLSADGYILTNAHILNGGDSLVVILPDRRAYHAVLTGVDDEADLALLKISENTLGFLEIGDSDLVKIGEPILAIGNPLELNSTVTAGILSARFRALDDSVDPFQINSYLQTDAASNEGMSGSALIDRSGKLIGINSAIISPSGAFVGYAFAIPSGIVKKALHDLKAYGLVKHAYLDISFSDMDYAQYKKHGIKKFSGVIINKVLKDGAGDQAGLRKDDVILKLEQHSIIAASQLRELVAQFAPGDIIKIIIQRETNEMEFKIALSGGSTHKTEKWTVSRPIKNNLSLKTYKKMGRKRQHFK